MSRESLVGVVVVAFMPDVEKLIRLTGNLAQQADHVVLVDNTPGGSDLSKEKLPDRVDLLTLNSNFGIAAGFNAGIRHLEQYRPAYVFLSDQDSDPAPDIINELVAAHISLSEKGRRVAVAGAIFVDPRHGHVEGFPVQDWKPLRLRKESDETGYVPASFLISSGSLIPWWVLDDVGLMNEELFIDFVDVEWCYRAHAKGFMCYGIPSAQMQHTIGDDYVEYSLPMGKLRRRNLHSPFRIYFQVRNTFLLCRMKHLPLCWKVWGLVTLIEKSYIYLVQIKEKRSQYRRNFLLGIWHGLMGKRGGYTWPAN